MYNHVSQQTLKESQTTLHFIPLPRLMEIACYMLRFM